MKSKKFIKFFHELTKREFSRLVKTHDLTWGEFKKQYPQPPWCSYPDAQVGIMGCWSLIDFIIKSPKDCKGCDCLIKKSQNEKSL